MSKVTFIIGNGFDLSLGLKTSYRDFYEYIKSLNLHPNNRIYKAIHEAPQTWSDFEVALGQYTHYIDKSLDGDRKNESIDFHEELEELRDDLADYLAKEEKRAKDMSDLPLFTETGYFEELPIGQANTISRVVSQMQVSMHFISLNYTETLKNTLTRYRSELLPRISLGFPHNIHGTLQDNLTLGVSDETQLSSTMSGAERDDLIKPTLIYSMNDSRIETLRKMIESSSVIVLFGTSIGETDKYIWELVNNWLGNGIGRYLIIHKHDDAYTDSVKRSSRRQKQFNSSVQDKILRYSGLDGDGITELKKRIFVVHNTKNLFNVSHNKR